jgi:hypothetical protein
VIRDFDAADHPVVRALWEAVGSSVLPDNRDGLALRQRLGYLRQPDVLCSEPV